MQRAALGFRVHSGWTALVAVSLDGGEPQVLLRRRPRLVSTFTYEFRQPYHTAERGPRPEAAGIIAQAESEATELAAQAIEAAESDLRRVRCRVSRCGLLMASGRPLPDLAGILASHALIHTADGELFRNAVLNASQVRGIAAFTLKERALIETASQTLGLPADKLAHRLTALGAGLGPPWSQDEKFSALVAWLALLN
jgi:hypothetical protein